MAAGPLTVTEVRTLLQQRWGASYDVHLIQRQRRIYLHIMWGYLEQLSFPLDEPTYLARLADVVAAINQLGLFYFLTSFLTNFFLMLLG